MLHSVTHVVPVSEPPVLYTLIPLRTVRVALSAPGHKSSVLYKLLPNWNHLCHTSCSDLGTVCVMQAWVQLAR